MGKTTPTRSLVKTRVLQQNAESGKHSTTKRTQNVVLPFSQQYNSQDSLFQDNTEMSEKKSYGIAALKFAHPAAHNPLFNNEWESSTTQKSSKKMEDILKTGKAQGILQKQNANLIELEEEIEEEEMYEPEYLLDKRITNGTVEYLVKWVEFPQSQSTWEQAENIQACAFDLIQQFEESHGKMVSPIAPKTLFSPITISPFSRSPMHKNSAVSPVGVGISKSSNNNTPIRESNKSATPKRSPTPMRDQKRVSTPVRNNCTEPLVILSNPTEKQADKPLTFVRETRQTARKEEKELEGVQNALAQRDPPKSLSKSTKGSSPQKEQQLPILHKETNLKQLITNPSLKSSSIQAQPALEVQADEKAITKRDKSPFLQLVKESALFQRKNPLDKSITLTPRGPLKPTNEAKRVDPSPQPQPQPDPKSLKPTNSHSLHVERQKLYQQIEVSEDLLKSPISKMQSSSPPRQNRFTKSELRKISVESETEDSGDIQQNKTEEREITKQLTAKKVTFSKNQSKTEVKNFRISRSVTPVHQLQSLSPLRQIPRHGFGAKSVSTTPIRSSSSTQKSILLNPVSPKPTSDKNGSIWNSKSKSNSKTIEIEQGPTTPVRMITKRSTSPSPIQRRAQYETGKLSVNQEQSDRSPQPMRSPLQTYYSSAQRNNNLLATLEIESGREDQFELKQQYETHVKLRETRIVMQTYSSKMEDALQRAKIGLEKIKQTTCPKEITDNLSSRILKRIVAQRNMEEEDDERLPSKRSQAPQIKTLKKQSKRKDPKVIEKKHFTRKRGECKNESEEEEDIEEIEEHTVKGKQKKEIIEVSTPLKNKKALKSLTKAEKKKEAEMELIQQKIKQKEEIKQEEEQGKNIKKQQDVTDTPLTGKKLRGRKRKNQVEEIIEVVPEVQVDLTKKSAKKRKTDDSSKLQITEKPQALEFVSVLNAISSKTEDTANTGSSGKRRRSRTKVPLISNPCFEVECSDGTKQLIPSSQLIQTHPTLIAQYFIEKYM